MMAATNWATHTTAFLTRRLPVVSRTGKTEYQLLLMKTSNRGRNVKLSTRTSQLPIFSTQLWCVQLTEITCWNSHAPLRPDWPSLGQKCMFYYCTGNVLHRASLRHTQPCRTSGPVWPNNVSGGQSSKCDSLPTNGAIYYSLCYCRRFCYRAALFKLRDIL